MNRDDVVHGIRKTWETAERLNLAEVYTNPGVLPLNEEFRDLILSSKSSYADVYIKALSLSHYNIILSDYSYFQFSLDRDSYVRYAYYPNPFISGQEDIDAFKRYQELVESDMISHEDYLSLLSDKKAVGGIPMLRYENAPDQRKKFHHPCSHFHIGFHSDNRWPLKRILTPHAFSLLVFKNYYGNSWKGAGDDEEEDVSNLFERQLIVEKSNCRLVPEEFFEKVEERSFYFT
jgi:hypothetical protein